MIRIAPSIRYADASRLRDEVDSVIVAGADWIHLPVFDDHYASNVVLAHDICRTLRSHCTVPIDVHLMVRPVDALAERFADAGADSITFHTGASPDAHRTLRMIRDLGCNAGLAYAPAEPLDGLEELLESVDQVLISSGNALSPAASFIDSALRKVAQARKLIDASGRHIRLEVDGGIEVETIGMWSEAGADTFVPGWTVFQEKDHVTVLAAMRARLAIPLRPRALHVSMQGGVAR